MLRHLAHVLLGWLVVGVRMLLLIAALVMVGAIRHPEAVDARIVGMLGAAGIAAGFLCGAHLVLLQFRQRKPRD